MPFCPKCGREIPSDAKFCTKCGSSVEMALSPAPSAYAPASPLADLGSRIVAGLIDYIIIGIVAAVLFFVAFAPFFALAPFGTMRRVDLLMSWSWFGGIFGIEFFLWLIYFTYFEGTSGQTIGKKFTHVKVVKQDGSPCDLGSAFVRNILRIVDSQPGGTYILGIILIAVIDKRQRLGDMLAGTIVVKS